MPSTAMQTTHKSEAEPVVEAERGDEGEGEEGAEHHELALGEVHDLGRLVDEDKAERDEAVDTAHGDTANRLLDEVEHSPPQIRALAVLVFCRRTPLLLAARAESGVDRTAAWHGLSHNL